MSRENFEIFVSEETSEASSLRTIAFLISRFVCFVPLRLLHFSLASRRPGLEPNLSLSRAIPLYHSLGE